MIIGFVGSAKGNSSITRRPHELPIRGHSLDVLDRFRQGYGNDVACLQCHPYAVFSVRQRTHGARTEVRGQHPVESVWPSAALQVAQNDATRLASGRFLQIALQVLADAAQTWCMQCVALVLVDQVVTDLGGPFSRSEE